MEAFKRPCRVAVVLRQLIDADEHELAEAVADAVYDRDQIAGTVQRKLRELPDPIYVNQRAIRRHRDMECEFCRRKRALHENP